MRWDRGRFICLILPSRTSRKHHLDEMAAFGRSSDSWVILMTVASQLESQCC